MNAHACKLTLNGYHWLKFDSVAMRTDHAHAVLYVENDYDAAEEEFVEWADSESDTGGWTPFSAEIPVLPSYLGKQHQLSIYGITDATSDHAAEPKGQHASNFFFDDISLKAFRCIP